MSPRRDHEPTLRRTHAREVAIAVHAPHAVHQWLAPRESLPFDETPGSPWLLLPPAVRVAFDAVTAAGRPLVDTLFGSPILGVKCGCNAAFIVALDDPASAPHVGDGPIVAVRSLASPGEGIRSRSTRGPVRQGYVERELLRPVVRGQTLRRWTLTRSPNGVPLDSGHRSDPANGAVERIIWTHGEPGSGDRRPCPRLPPLATRWLSHWRHRLAARSDTRGQLPWWALFRTESASDLGPRVVWSDIGRSPRAAVLAAHDPTVPLNSCYVVRAPTLEDAWAFSALLNSAPAAAWLNALAEPARGDYRRYLGWTVALLPVPCRWESAQAELATLAAAASMGDPPSAPDLTAAVLAAYGLDFDIVQPLLDWNAP